MKKNFKSFLLVAVATATISSCTTLSKSMKEPNTRVELKKSDFTLSDQVSAEATSSKIIGIDFSRLFNSKTGNIEGGTPGLSLASIPVVGDVLNDKTANFALYELMKNNTGYDVVFYPQYETIVKKPILGIGFFGKTTTVKATARLGKLIK